MQSVTVSLTTTSGRIGKVHEVVGTLLAQSVTPSRIVLWVSSDAYLLDDGITEGEIPPSLAQLVGPHFEIRWTQNTGPYRKLLPALRHFGGLVVTADDDTLYPSTWLAGLLGMHASTPEAICCYRAHRMLVNDDGQFVSYWRWPTFDRDRATLDCFPTGKDGVLYPPNSLHENVFDVDRFRSLAPTSDDIWFKVMALKRGTTARGVIGHEAFSLVNAARHLDGLYARYNLLGNDETLVRVFRACGLSPKIVGPELA